MYGGTVPGALSCVKSQVVDHLDSSASRGWATVRIWPYRLVKRRCWFQLVNVEVSRRRRRRAGGWRESR